MGVARSKGQPAPLYRRLPHGPSGLASERVAGNQRGRMLGAIVESVAQRGYQATSVAHVIALAGVSRRAFYEQFAHKQQCCLCAHDVIVAHARRHVLEAWASEHGWANRLHGACTALLGAAAASPKGARLVVIDAPAIGPSGREHMQLADLSFERLLADALRSAPDEVGFPRLTAQAIVGGVRNVLFVRLRAGRESELLELSADVLAWIASYRPATAARLDALRAAAPHRAAPAPVHAGAAEQIAAQAGTEALLEELFGAALDSARSALAAAPDWPQGARAALAAFVAEVLAGGELTRLASIDQLGVGPGAGGRLTCAAADLTALLCAAAPPAEHGGEVAREALTGALTAMLASSVPRGGLERAPGIADHLAFTVIAPYLGADAALESIAAGRTREQS